MGNIGKNTELCISLAGRPSNFGATLFSLLFEKMGMDWAYKPFQVNSRDLAGAVSAVRALGIRGCGVSMPHKVRVMRYLDGVAPAAKKNWRSKHNCQQKWNVDWIQH